MIGTSCTACARLPRCEELRTLAPRTWRPISWLPARRPPLHDGVTTSCDSEFSTLLPFPHRGPKSHEQNPNCCLH